MVFTGREIVEALDFRRLTATEGESRGIEVIGGYIEKLGFEYHLESFEISAYDLGEAVVKAGELSVEAVPYGQNTDAEVTAELIVIENLDQLKSCGTRYAGKIIMSKGGKRNLPELLEKAKVAGFINVGAPAHGVFGGCHRQHWQDHDILPCMNVAYADGVKLLDFEGKEVTLTIKQIREKRMANNIVVNVKGTDPDGLMTYVVGHYDSVANTPGATDNTGGTACILKVLEHFASNPPMRDLTAVFFTGEEVGLLGSQAYAKAHADEIAENGRLVVNIDVAGDEIGHNTLAVLGTRELMGYADGINRENGLFFARSVDIFSSDCIPFSVFEVPSLNIARWGGEGTFYNHTADDHVRYVSEKGLRGSYMSAIIILDRVLNAEIYPVEKEIDESVKEKLEKYLWNLTGEKPELKWTEKYQK